MDTRLSKHGYWLVLCVLIIAVSAVMAYAIERDFGKVDIQFIGITDPSGVTLAGKLFRHKDASIENKMPGVLNLHGYQNDKGVQDSFSIELARRGFVVLALDAYGHGDSGGSLGMNEDPTNGTNTRYLYLKNIP